MKAREIIGVAASATAIALAIFGNFLLFAVAMSTMNDPHGITPWNVVKILHPGLWYLLAALVIRQVGCVVSGRHNPDGRGSGGRP